MSRTEFSKAVRRQAVGRANGQCEGSMRDGSRCVCRVSAGRQHFDHDLPDWMGGEATLENCRVLCIPCHTEKTAKRDAPLIAKTKRILDNEQGIRTQSRLKGQGFRKAPKQRTASRPLNKRIAAVCEEIGSDGGVMNHV